MSIDKKVKGFFSLTWRNPLCSRRFLPGRNICPPAESDSRRTWGTWSASVCPEPSGWTCPGCVDCSRHTGGSLRGGQGHTSGGAITINTKNIPGRFQPGLAQNIRIFFPLRVKDIKERSFTQLYSCLSVVNCCLFITIIIYLLCLIIFRPFYFFPI